MQNNLDFQTFILVEPNKFILTVTDQKMKLFLKKFKNTYVDEKKRSII